MAVELKKYSAVSAINLTPLIDVVFQLLIFFLVASNISDQEQKLKLDLPSVNEALPAMFQPQELVVNIDPDGKYFIDGKFYPLEQVEQILRRAQANNPLTQAVLVRADRATDWERVATLLNLLKQIGIKEYSAVLEEQEIP
jgi:biopolymer transport protein ExbD